MITSYIHIFNIIFKITKNIQKKGNKYNNKNDVNITK